MFKATLAKPSILTDSISTVAELIDEGIFKLTKEGISLVAADRAMVAVVDFFMSSDAFEKYELDKEQSIGINIINLLSVLKRAGSGDKVTVALQDNKLEVLIEGKSKRRFVIPLLDIAPEEVPPVDQLEFTSQVSLKPDVLQSGVEDAEIVSDSVVVETSPNSFLMRAEGDISRTELELKSGDEPLLEVKASGSVRARYPLDYLKKMMKAAKLSDVVRIKYAQDYPMKMEFETSDKKVSLSFVLAPRVSESE
jgi:proliferating cell nuclear antigen PCNA